MLWRSAAPLWISRWGGWMKGGEEWRCKKRRTQAWCERIKMGRDMRRRKETTSVNESWIPEKIELLKKMLMKTLSSEGDLIFCLSPFPLNFLSYFIPQPPRWIKSNQIISIPRSITMTLPAFVRGRKFAVRKHEKWECITKRQGRVALKPGGGASRIPYRRK